MKFEPKYIFKMPTRGKGALKTMKPLTKENLEDAKVKARGNRFFIANSLKNRKQRRS